MTQNISIALKYKPCQSPNFPNTIGLYVDSFFFLLPLSTFSPPSTPPYLFLFPDYEIFYSPNLFFEVGSSFTCINTGNPYGVINKQGIYPTLFFSPPPLQPSFISFPFSPFVFINILLDIQVQYNKAISSWWMGLLLPIPFTLFIIFIGTFHFLPPPSCSLCQPLLPSSPITVV